MLLHQLFQPLGNQGIELGRGWARLGTIAGAEGKEVGPRGLRGGSSSPQGTREASSEAAQEICCLLLGRTPGWSWDRGPSDFTALKEGRQNLQCVLSETQLFRAGHGGTWLAVVSPSHWRTRFLTISTNFYFGSSTFPRLRTGPTRQPPQRRRGGAFFCGHLHMAFPACL